MLKLLWVGGGATLIDSEDYERVKGYDWRLREDGRVHAIIDGKFTLLHRFLINALRGKHVDHIDGNPLHNAKANLRLCDPHSNTLNQVGKPQQRKCAYKGVTMKGGMLIATISNKRLRKGVRYIGGFVTEREAAIAYDIIAREMHGEFARLNLPDAKASEVAAVQSIIDSPKANIRKATSRYIGVGFHRISGRWRARIGQKIVGYFTNEADAARSLGYAI